MYRTAHPCFFILPLLLLFSLVLSACLGQHQVYGSMGGSPATPAPAPLEPYFYHVTMRTADDGWVMGGSFNTSGRSASMTTQYYVHGHWLSVPVDTVLFSISIVSATSIWGVGFQGAIEHYNGQQWQTVSSPTSTILRDVSMLSAKAGWAVGDQATIIAYDGQQWHTVPLSSTVHGRLLSLSMLSAQNGWAVG
ncbi:MAG: hypothetical protein NVS4B1_32580 [Ktedonobacteraceae bacterium]